MGEKGGLIMSFQRNFCKSILLKSLILSVCFSVIAIAGWTYTAQAATDCNAVTGIPAAECQQLLSLYNSNGGANWKNKTGWNQTNTPCSWFGVSCELGHVTGIGLCQNGLSGTIPNFNLPNLKELYLIGNQLSGSIPNFNLPNLTLLHLVSNQLSGSIPNFNLPKLEELFLYENQLSGSIPNFSSLPKLKGIVLAYNQLSGTIPNFPAFNLSNLGAAYFTNNCGLVAYNAAQEIVLNQKDPDWKIRNPNCPVPTNCNAVTEIPAAECQELLSLYNSTGGANWTNKTGWNQTNTPCSWFGVTCTAGHVAKIDLADNGNNSDGVYGNGLKGQIPNLNLPELTYLGLDNNQLSGSLPNFNLPKVISTIKFT